VGIPKSKYILPRNLEAFLNGLEIKKRVKNNMTSEEGD
jgi:hypothetical protein